MPPSIVGSPKTVINLLSQVMGPIILQINIQKGEPVKTPDYYISEAETAKFLSISRSKLRNDRYRKRGLPYFKDGRLVRYSLSTIKAYVDDRTIDPDDD